MIHIRLWRDGGDVVAHAPAVEDDGLYCYGATLDDALEQLIVELDLALENGTIAWAST